MNSVLVTGASGFVGQSVCRHFLRQGFRVRAAVRSAARFSSPSSGMEIVEIDSVEAKPNWLLALQGIDVVVHLVARTHVMREAKGDVLERYRAVNVKGTQQLLEACSQAGIRRFVFMSSIKAVGEGAAQAYTEDDPCQPEDEYGISKREAEELVLSQTKFETVVLRPPLVYGRGVRGNLARILKAIERGIPLPLGGIKNSRSMVHVQNLADAVAHVVAHPAARGVYHVADDRPVSTTEFVRLLGEGLNRPPRLWSMPASLLRLIGTATGRQDEIRRLLGSLTVSTEKIRRELNWHPTIRIEEGLRNLATPQQSPPHEAATRRRAA